MLEGPGEPAPVLAPLHLVQAGLGIGEDPHPVPAPFAGAVGADTLIGPAPEDAPESPFTSDVQEVSLDLVARGLAVALEDEALRRQIVEDLRDSPFLFQALHLPSYLSGERGSSILAAMGQALGQDADALASAVDRLGNVELRMPSTLARFRWDGDPDGLAVVPWEPEFYVDAQVSGYGAGGEDVRIAAHEPSTAPVMSLRPSPIDFGPDPEARRAAAPRRNYSTVSDPTVPDPGDDDPLADIDCEEDPTQPECEEGEGGSGPPAYSVSGTGSFCWVDDGASGDDDSDGFLDSCEYAVARAFAPELRIQSGDSYSSREPYWAAEADEDGARIFYALAYHRDADHYGDSEFIVMDVEYGPGSYWRFEKVFLSAHYGAPTPGYDSSEWVPRNTYPAYSNQRPHVPVVWVADGKHANYKSQDACNSGANATDDCSGPSVIENIAVFSDANLGRRYDTILNCVDSRSDYPGNECFWTADRFEGWYSDPPSDASGYRGHLNDSMME